MIGPETRPEFVNRIVNSDAVRPFFRPDGQPVDLTPLVEMRPTQSGCVVLSNGEDAVAIFELTAPGIYQGHTLFGPTCRGRRAIDTAKEMVAWMFAHGASAVWGATPRENKKACWFNRQIGAKPLPTSDADTEVFEIRKPGTTPSASRTNDQASIVMRHDDIDAFLAEAPISDEFRNFVRATKPLIGPITTPQIIIFSNGSDTAVAFAFLARRAWQMFAESLSAVSQEAMAASVRSMVRLMFEHGADNIFCVGRPGDTRWQEFHRAIGARSLEQHDEHEIFEITRRMH